MNRARRDVPERFRGQVLVSSWPVPAALFFWVVKWPANYLARWPGAWAAQALADLAMFAIADKIRALSVSAIADK